MGLAYRKGFFREKSLILFVLLLSLIMFLFPLPVQGGTKFLDEFLAEADTFVNSEDSSANFGGFNYIEVADASYPGKSTGYLRFDLSGVTGNIISANLKLYSRYVNETHNVGIHVCSNSSWDELTVTYSNSPPYNSNVIVTQLVASEYIWYSWDVTGIVQPNEMLTLCIVSESSHNSGMIWFYSKEAGYEEAPVLEIIRVSTDAKVSGLGVISGIIREGDSKKYSLDLQPSDLLYIYLQIDRGNVVLRINTYKTTLASWEVTNQTILRIAVNASGTYEIIIENPRADRTGDEIEIFGYYVIYANASELALITLDVDVERGSKIVTYIFLAFIIIVPSVIGVIGLKVYLKRDLRKQKSPLVSPPGYSPPIQHSKPTRFCSRCGATLHPGQNFCFECGNRLG